MTRGGGQGLARVAVVVRAGAGPLWWLGVFAAGIGVLVPGLTGRRIGVLAGAALFIVATGVVAYVRRGRYTALSRSVARAGKHDVLQDRAVTARDWRRVELTSGPEGVMVVRRGNGAGGWMLHDLWLAECAAADGA